jgi:hypothetical protein
MFANCEILQIMFANCESLRIMFANCESLRERERERERGEICVYFNKREGLIDLVMYKYNLEIFFW